MKTKTLIPLLATAAVILGVLTVRASQASPNTAQAKTAETSQASVNHCEGYIDKTVVVSIEKRHLWACQNGESAYDSPVVTGDMNNVENLTPTGTYTIYAKQTNRTLSGSDSKGAWNVHVNYWLPFLHNQYGSYGFHDATWRNDSEFGNVDPYSSNASHGCVELPLATAKWLYDWSAVGTQVIIQN